MRNFQFSLLGIELSIEFNFHSDAQMHFEAHPHGQKAVLIPPQPQSDQPSKKPVSCIPSRNEIERLSNISLRNIDASIKRYSKIGK